MDATHAARDWRDHAVAVRGGSLATQAMGDEHDPALLLLGGMTWSRDWWSDELCALLAARGFRVIRFDPRDTGESTLSSPGAPDYDADDLAGDALAVLDAHDASQAFLLGLSMGGGLAQSIAAAAPERMLGLVLVATSPAFDTLDELPPPTAALRATFADEQPSPDWADEAAVVDWVVASERPYAGPDSFDEQAMRELVSRTWRRTPSLEPASSNHPLVAGGGSPVDVAMLRGIPTLVVHGSADPLFPLPHGEALARALDAGLLVLDGMGHQAPPPATWATLVDHVARLRGAASGR